METHRTMNPPAFQAGENVNLLIIGKGAKPTSFKRGTNASELLSSVLNRSLCLNILLNRRVHLNNVNLYERIRISDSNSHVFAKLRCTPQRTRPPFNLTLNPVRRWIFLTPLSVETVLSYTDLLPIPCLYFYQIPALLPST